MSVSDESVTLSNASKEEIAREIKEIFSYVKVSSEKVIWRTYLLMSITYHIYDFYSFIFRAQIVIIMS